MFFMVNIVCGYAKRFEDSKEEVTNKINELFAELKLQAHQSRLTTKADRRQTKLEDSRA